MIGHLRGNLEYISESGVMIECAGIGYLVNAAPFTIARLGELGSEVKLFTYLQVREDGLSLFGFYSMQELELFKLLITVSGVGPKVGMSVLSALTPEQLTLALASEDADELAKAPGVGKKTAQRMVLELRDKISKNELTQSMETSGDSSSSNEKKDAVDALLALGFSRSESVKTVMEVAIDGATREQIIKHALKKLKS